MIEEVLAQYDIPGTPVKTTINSKGIINTTYIVTYSDGKKYIVQKINTSVFENPYIIMNNIDQVTKHISKRGILKSPLTIVHSRNNGPLVSVMNNHGEKEYYRVYNYIDNSKTFFSLENVPNACIIAYNAGAAFGQFHKSLIDFPITNLRETIPNFHNTPKRIGDLLDSIKSDVLKRATEYSREIVDLYTKSDDVSFIYANLGKEIPLRVTHNDTKINNVLFDKNNNSVISVVDLDTLMPGSVLFDIGDGIRSTCSTTPEDETDLSKVRLNMEFTKAYLRGYLDVMKDYLSESEINNIALSIKTLTYELSIRFLTDYINGDVYFKIKYPHHNADRFKNQYVLLQDIERREDEIQEYVNDYVRKRQ